MAADGKLPLLLPKSGGNLKYIALPWRRSLSLLSVQVQQVLHLRFLLLNMKSMYGAFSLNPSTFDSSNDGQSIILEKEQGITEDPRGVYLAGDAVRVLWDIGIREQMADIGHRESYRFQGRRQHQSTC